MKKILTLMVSFVMLMSFLPGSVNAAENVSSQQNALEMFGFPLDPDSYDTQTLKQGTYPVSPKYDLYVDNYSKIQKYPVDKYTNSNNTIYARLTDSPTSTANGENVAYSAVTGFASTSTGVDDCIAKVYFPYGRKGANIRLSIYDANGNALVTGYETGGYVRTTDEIEMWEVEGLLSITAGDFDGDGYDEIAVYTPNNADPNSPTHVSVGIFEFDKSTKKLSTKQYIDLSSKASGEICEWEYSNDHDVVQFYCLPYVAMSANDLSRDGIDDLSAIVNFSTWYRGTESSRTYTTQQILNHNTHFASVLESYEGTKGGSLRQVIKHRVLVTTPLAGGSASNTGAEHRYILRNANLTVGDVTHEGSQEIIIAGNYTRVNVHNTADNTTNAGGSRLVEVDSNHALCHIVGYTTYDNLKNHNTYDLNSDYHWTVQRDGNKWTYWYNEDSTDSGPITTSLAAFKYQGTGYADTIFVGGQLFAYDNEEGKLKFLYNYNGDGKLYHGTNGKERDVSVVWIGGAIAGNFSEDVFGREVLVFPFYLKVSGKEQFTCKLLTFGEGTSNQHNGGTTTQISQIRYSFEDAGQRLVSLAILDGGGKTSYITYPGNDYDIYYSDIEVLSILQAPPIYEELVDEEYFMDSSTSFEKSESSSDAFSKSISFSAGPIVGFEYEANFLGIFPVAGAEYEFSITASVTGEKTQETTFSYATGFETTGTTDAVTVFTVPHVRYHCQMYMPEYKTPTQEDYNTLCAFKSELEANLKKYQQTGEEQITGTYVKGCKYFDYKYSSFVSSDNYQDQLDVLQKVSNEIDFIKEGIASFGNGGTANWGETVKASVIPYTYSVPQTPLLVTVDVATYDSIAEYTPGLEKIYGNVFDEHYRAGDPNTYAKSIGQLHAVDKVLEAKGVGNSSTDGFLTNNTASANKTTQSQTISVEESNSSSIGWGLAVSNTSIGSGSIAKAGFTASLEDNFSYITTTTKGHTYSARQVAIPDFAPDGYGYDWKLVSYRTRLNGSDVPVVGYVVRNVQTPPSVAQNIQVTDITDNCATITWENGSRPADYYKLSLVYMSNGREYTQTIATNIRSENGRYSYTVDHLDPNSTNRYVLESYNDNGKYSVPTQEKIVVTTFPADFSATIAVTGMDNNIIYRNGKAFHLTTNVTGNEGYRTFYQWQLDTGDGWEDIHGQNDREFQFTISPLDNGKRVRCVSVIVISADSSYVLYSEPIEMNCARTDGDYQVDWEGNNILVTHADGTAAANAFVRVTDANDKLVTVVPIDSQADLSEYLGKNYHLRLMIWNDDLSPETLPFER